MPGDEALDARRDPLKLAQHEPMARIDFDTPVRTEPAFQYRR